MKLVLRGGRVVDTAGARTADVLISEGRIVEVAATIDAPADATLLDCSGCVVGPGLVDLHTHLREPGDPEAETIETGSRAAALGGYTAVQAMPNTDPTIDSAAVVDLVRRQSKAALCEVIPTAAITMGRRGEQLAPFGELAEAGVRFFTDDGSGVQDAGLMRRALEYARPFGVVLAQHCEDSALAGGGHMHEGACSSRLGIPGMSALAEEVMVARDIELARVTGGRIHFLHVSTARSVELVVDARQEGLNVTCEVAPHHLVLSDESLESFDPLFKVNPPLRPPADVAALRDALNDGSIDAVATDHAPHPPQAKAAPLAEAPPGMLGLQTALPIVLEVLTSKDPDSAVETALMRLSWVPAAIGQISGQGRPVAPGEPANLCVFDPGQSWTVDPQRLASRARNTPYAGRTMTGQVRHTVFRGEAVVVDGEATR
jgi:dihydroorotase